MFTTGVKISIIEGLVAGFNALNPTGALPSSTSLDLTPNSVTIEYPLEEVQWPAIYVQFRPTKSQWTGLNPDVFTTVSGQSTSSSTRQIYFEGVIDFQILAMHSEERDRLQDSLYNLILMDPTSPASLAFYTSINANDLVAMTILESTVTTIGDSVSLGTPYSAEELTYESTLRVQCVGQAYETKYDNVYQNISAVTTSGSMFVVVE
jgi:hypothetical protein